LVTVRLVVSQWLLELTRFVFDEVKTTFHDTDFELLTLYVELLVLYEIEPVPLSVPEV
jgi:hypothetical protein